MSRRAKLPTPPPGSIVTIHWFDAWRNPDEHGTAADLVAQGDLFMCVDVGFYVGATPKYVIIAEERMGEEWRHIHRIPRVNIKKMTVVYEGPI